MNSKANAFDEQHGRYRALCEEALAAAARDTFTEGSALCDAARYALLGGGKRVRGVLVWAAGELLGTAPALAAFSAAIEMIHAFSLIHDDLPCMDDADLRRGRPSVHKAYGEAAAVLAGDLLALAAFEVIAKSGASAHTRAEAAALLAGAAGGRGMIYGQELDLKYENAPCGEAALRLLHEKKTGALIAAAVGLGALAAGHSPASAPELMAYASKTGLVFQIMDDILDATATAGQLGKPAGGDAAKGKTTFVTLLGLEKARGQARLLTDEAAGGLRAAYGERADFLCRYAESLVRRIF